LVALPASAISSRIFISAIPELFSFRDDGDEVEIMNLARLWRAVRDRETSHRARRSRWNSGSAGDAVDVLSGDRAGRGADLSSEGLPESLVVTGPGWSSNFTTSGQSGRRRAQRRPEGHLVVQCGT